MTSKRTETDNYPPRASGAVPLLKQVLPLPDGPDQTSWVVDREIPMGREVDSRLGLSLAYDSKASKQHALLRRRDGSVEITDLGSRNHTFVNGRQISTATLGDGAVLRVGNSLFVLRYERADATDAPRAEEALHGRLLGQSQEVRKLRHSLSQNAPSVSPVLLTGPTGTGKELGAAAVHALSARSRHPFIAVNCAAIPAPAAESALFGHRRGAFTGAERAHDGYFQQADSGTLFLDEVGELSLEVQGKLLRALQGAEGSASTPTRNTLRIQPYGDRSDVKVDVRVIAATNVELSQAVAAGKFRADLFHRLAVLPVRFPSLVERRDDILLILHHYLNLNRPAPGERRVSARLGELLLLYPWPGNVRQLENIAKRLMVVAPASATLDLNELPDDLLSELTATSAPPSVPQTEGATPVLQEQPITLELLTRLLNENDGLISRVARQLGRSTRQIRRRMDEFGIPRPAARQHTDRANGTQPADGNEADEDADP